MRGTGRNSLFRLAAAAGLLLGVFLLMGASGHFAAVGFGPGGELQGSFGKRFALVLPGLILAGTGLVNIGVCRALWSGAAWSLHLALLCNGVAAMYLLYLMSTDLPGHPVGEFLALVSSHIVLLSAIRLGLVWPAEQARN